MTWGVMRVASESKPKPLCEDIVAFIRALHVADELLLRVGMLSEASASASAAASARWAVICVSLAASSWAAAMCAGGTSEGGVS